MLQLKLGFKAVIKIAVQLLLWSTQVVVEVNVELCNRCTLVAWVTTFSVGWWVGVESENKAISAFN